MRTLYVTSKISGISLDTEMRTYLLTYLLIHSLTPPLVGSKAI